MPGFLLDDDYWLDQGRHYGLELTNRDQLLDVAAVGLTVLCWRNTRLEDVHAGVERYSRLKLAGEDPEDATVVERERRAEQSYFDALNADWDDLVVLDPNETQRMSRFLDGRAQGFGIPDDIMMRLNVSSALDVREVLADVLPDASTEPGAVLHYDRRRAPIHVAELVSLLQDPDRELLVGGATVTAGDVLGESWDRYTNDVVSKVGMHLKYCDVIGARRAIWQIALSGVAYAGAWYPSPWWTRAVDLLRRAEAEGRITDVFGREGRASAIPAPVDTFRDTLRTNPAQLNGPQCSWVQLTELRAFLRRVRDEDRSRLQPAGELTFNGFSALF